MSILFPPGRLSRAFHPDLRAQHCSAQYRVRMEQWSCIRPDNRSQLIEYQELHRRPIVGEGVKKMDPESWRSFTLHMAIPERKKMDHGLRVARRYAFVTIASH